MSEKCTHETAEVFGEYGEFVLLRCTWACGKFFIRIGSPLNCQSFTADELAAKDALLAEAWEALKPMEEPVSYYETTGGKYCLWCGADALDDGETQITHHEKCGWVLRAAVLKKLEGMK